MRNYHCWTADERALLATLWGTHSVAYLGRRLKMTGSQVRNQAAQMGLKPRVEAWKTHEDRLLLEQYAQAGTRALSELLGRTRGAVKQRARVLRRALASEVSKANVDQVLAKAA